ncbi:uncharacterized protein [Drosophila pseudoobscura]|uniref:BED-type domain-containing protein n=1 Tax=Drosophila pseudoobscura pseudoobscura TaxID=46245 RepID=A0A6I8VJZ1_DROPS|nr:uncharacterized protein LOC26533927 [Drosophila pseudoobscura]
MGRKRDYFLREFFNFEVERNASVCNICRHVMKGSYTTNLRRHLLAEHKSQYDIAVREWEKSKPVEKTKRISFTFATTEVKEACVQLVTTGRMPIVALDSEPFKTLTSQIFSGLEMIPITSRNIMEHVAEKFEIVKASIVNGMKLKLVSLKLDIASGHGRGILGVSAQFYEDKAIKVVTLGVIELNKEHTGASLGAETKNILEEFGLTRNQIYSVTSDNGRDVIKSIGIKNEDFDGSCDDVEEELKPQVNIYSVASIRCAAHTLQLAVKDFLKTFANDTLIGKARRLVKALRTVTYRASISNEGLPQPLIDSPTMWTSTYEMLERLLLLKNFCENHGNELLTFSEADWTEVKVLAEALEPIYLANQKLQTEQLYLGDFYKMWLDLTLTMAAMKNPHSAALREAIGKREESLTSNESVTSAIYLDPRMRIILSKNPIKLMCARNHLTTVFKKIYGVAKRDDLSLRTNSHSSESTAPDLKLPSTSQLSTASQSTCSSLNDFLNSFVVASGNEESDEDEAQYEVQLAINEINDYCPKPIDINQNIMSYWEEKKFIYPCLYQLAKVIHCVPATRVSVERTFSALKLDLSDLRRHLSENAVKQIIFLRLNTS